MFKQYPVVSKQFANGFTVYVSPCKCTAIQVDLCVKTGSIHEERYLGCGVSHFLEHMLFQGCRNYPARSVTDAVANSGGMMNAYTGFDRTDYHINLPAKFVDKAIDILFSMVKYPELDQNICAKEKDVILRECDISLDNPGSRVINKLISAVYQAHPVRIPVIGLKEMICNVTSKELADYHKRRYTPDKCFMVVTGNADINHIFDVVAGYMENWFPEYANEPILPAEPEQFWMRRNEFTFSDNLSRIVIGTRPANNAENLAAHSILWGAMGMGCAGVLPVKFTVNNPLALDLRIIDSNIPGGGISAVSAVANEKNIGKLERGILNELENIAKNGISSKLIAQEKAQHYAEKLRRANDIEAVSADIIECVMLNGTPDTNDTLYERIKKVSAEEVAEVARKELKESQMSIIIQHSAKSEAKTVFIKQSNSVINTSIEKGNCQLLSLSDKSIPQISFSMVMPAGPLFDPAGLTGLSSMAVKMLASGTDKLNEEQLLTRLDRYGADFEIRCHANSAICQLTAPRKSFSKAFELLTGMLKKREFDINIFERERNRIFDTLEHSKLTPISVATRRSLMLLMNGHASALGVDGSIETLSNITLECTGKHLNKMLNPEKMKIGFAGDISADEAKIYATELLDVCKNDTSSLEITPEELRFASSELHESIKLNKEQLAVVMSIAGTQAVSRKEQYAIQIMRQLENGLSSKLFERVREDNSLAYAVGCSIKSGLRRGAISFYAKTLKGRTNDVTALFKEELERLKKHNISETEFCRAREQAAFAACSNLHIPSCLLLELLLDLYYGNRIPASAEEIEQEYASFSPDDFYAVFDNVLSEAVPITVEAGNI